MKTKNHFILFLIIFSLLFTTLSISSCDDINLNDDFHVTCNDDEVKEVLLNIYKNKLIKSGISLSQDDSISVVDIVTISVDDSHKNCKCKGVLLHNDKKFITEYDAHYTDDRKLVVYSNTTYLPD